MLVSEFMHKKEKRFNPFNELILNPVFKRDLEFFVNTYYPDLTQRQIKDAVNSFCGKYAGYRQTYGPIFIEKALIQIFF